MKIYNSQIDDLQYDKFTLVRMLREQKREFDINK